MDNKENTLMAHKVGETMPMTFGVGGKHGYGFSVQNGYGAPLLSIVYATEDEARAAEEGIRAVLEKAIGLADSRGAFT
jgi:hypothetical protein